MTEIMLWKRVSIYEGVQIFHDITKENFAKGT